MTNLIEKSLLIGFGIFTLTIFSSILVPYLGKIAEFNQNEKNKHNITSNSGLNSHFSDKYVKQEENNNNNK